MFALPDDVETPAVVIDLDILEANLKHTADLAKRAGVKLRPHTKTHKSVWIAQQQLAYGASGITVAKLGEAEVMADAGIDDILIAYPIVGRAKLERLRRLMARVRVAVSTDDYQVAKGLSDLGESMNRRIPLYIDVNTGLNRCGREPGEETAELVTAIGSLPGVEVVALMTHAGHAYAKTDAEGRREVAVAEAEALVKTQELLRTKGIRVPEISVGSTPTSKHIGDVRGVTEMRPGAYVFGDCSQLFAGMIDERECAMRVYATVVSTPRPGMAIIDAGSKTLTNDLCQHRPGYGYIPEIPGAVVERLSEEHGHVKLPEGTGLRVGDVVSVIPNHCCTVTNLHDHLLGFRGGRLERRIRVDARGKIH